MKNTKTKEKKRKEKELRILLIFFSAIVMLYFAQTIRFMDQWNLHVPHIYRIFIRFDGI